MGGEEWYLLAFGGCHVDCVGCCDLLEVLWYDLIFGEKSDQVVQD